MNGAPLASRLEGKTIDKWLILKKRVKTEEDPSGYFSSCYEVENIHSKQPGFLKAFNYIYAFSTVGAGQQSTDLMEQLVATFNYERDLLNLCRGHRMSRIVTAVDYGEYVEAGEIPVPYLIFEIAQGSLKNIKLLKNPDLKWKLGAFHGFLVGLSQLHNKKIAHQDIKPSNILIFGHNFSKLADLGNATQQNNTSPRWDKNEHCGDLRFTPIELLYGYYSPDWNTRRLGADLFMAGGIITYLITDSNFLWLLLKNLPDNYNPVVNFGGSFEQAKPHVITAYYITLSKIEQSIPPIIRQDLVKIIEQLTHPVPEDRGNPPTLRTSLSRYSLQRYISIIDRLAKTLEVINP